MGDLVLHTAAAPIRHRKPFIYQEGERGRQEIAGRYVLKGKQQVGFEVAAYDASRPLVIDPVLEYFTFLGGNDYDFGWASPWMPWATPTSREKPGRPTSRRSWRSTTALAMMMFS